MADERLKDIAQSILDTLSDALTTAGIDVPTRQYIHSGQIAQDLVGENCGDALVVGWNGMSQMASDATVTPIGPTIKCAVPLVAQFTVALIRCVPTLKDTESDPFPTAAELQASGEAILTDALTLPAVAIDEQLAGMLTGLQCSLVGIGNVLPIGPFGAVGGTSLVLVVSLV
jgi:hypothetical protein